MAFPLFLDLHQEMRLYRKKVLKLFVCAHKKHYLCTRNKESKDKRLVKRITEKIDWVLKERKKIMMTFGIMTVAVVAFAVIAFAGINLGINACK